MRIVFYHDDQKKINLENIYNISASGTVYSLMWLAKGLSECGHEVIIMNKSENIQIYNIQFINIGSHSQLEKKIKTLSQVDIFIAVGGAGNIFHTSKLNIPVKIFWLHNYISNDEQKLYDEDIKMNRLDRIVCVSKYHLSTLSKLKNILKCSYIYNSINLELIPKYLEKKLSKNIGFVGSITEAKGLHNILFVISELRKIRQDFRFYIFGSIDIYGNNVKQLGKSGIAEKEYEDKYLAKYLFDKNTDKIHDYITLKGALGREDLYKELQAINLCLQDLNWDGSSETFGVGALEVQALGIPVITNFRGGQPEVISNNKSGFYIKNQDTKCTTDKISYVLDMEDKEYKKLSNNSILNSRRFDYKIISKEWEKDLIKMSNNKNYIFTAKIIKSIITRFRIKIGI